MITSSRAMFEDSLQHARANQTSHGPSDSRVFSFSFDVRILPRTDAPTHILLLDCAGSIIVHAENSPWGIPSGKL